MFSTDTVIDCVQDANKKFVNTFVFNDSLKKELVKIIDSNTEFAKTQAKTAFSVAETVFKNVSDSVYSAARAGK